MNTFIILFVIYIIFMIYLGYLGSKKTTSIQSYSVSSGDVSIFATSITFAACFMSAGTFLGVAGQGFAFGTTVLWFWASQWTTCGIALAIIGKGYRKFAGRFNSLSVPDWIADRYNCEFLRIFIAIVSLLQIIYIASQLVGVGVVMNTMTGISYQFGVIIGAAVVVTYLVLGGTYAHIYTNVAQGILMLIIAIIVGVTGFFLFGNIFTEVPARLAEIEPNLSKGLNPSNMGYPTTAHVVGMFVAHLWWAINPQLINKTQYLKKDGDMKKFILLNAVFMFLGGMIVLGGLYCRILIPEGVGPGGLATMDAATPTFIAKMYPTIFAAIFNIVVLAATMSTVDGIILYLSTVIGNTMYRESWVKFQKRKGISMDQAAIDRRSVLLSRWATLMVCVVAIPIAFWRPPNLTSWLWFASGGILSTIVGPIAVGIYKENTGRKAAMLGAVGGFGVYMFLFFSNIVPSVYLNCGIGGIVSILLTWLGAKIFEPMPAGEVLEILGHPSAPTSGTNASVA